MLLSPYPTAAERIRVGALWVCCVLILVFLVVPKAVEARLRTAGANYYVRRSESLAAALQPGQCLIRLVASFATGPDEVDRFVELAAKP